MFFKNSHNWPINKHVKALRCASLYSYDAASRPLEAQAGWKKLVSSPLSRVWLQTELRGKTTEREEAQRRYCASVKIIEESQPKTRIVPHPVAIAGPEPRLKLAEQFAPPAETRNQQMSASLQKMRDWLEEDSKRSEEPYTPATIAQRPMEHVCRPRYVDYLPQQRLLDAVKRKI